MVVVVVVVQVMVAMVVVVVVVLVGPLLRHLTTTITNTTTTVDGGGLPFPPGQYFVHVSPYYTLDQIGKLGVVKSTQISLIHKWFRMF